MLQNDTSQRAKRLNAQLAHSQAQGVLLAALRHAEFGKVALVSSFGAEAAVLLHMVAQIDRSTPVLFIDTLMLFPETLEYQASLGAQLGLSDIRILRTEAAALAQADPDDALHKTQPDSCCALRKAAPLAAALAGFDAWISGRKRYQGGSRSDLPMVEEEVGTHRIKLNPLANWTSDDMRAYASWHDLPPHPLTAKGYGSIGCAPCTSPAAGRDGRWPGQAKTECGIHFDGGRSTRTGALA
jgi:phosphoadenosine phosphosulfate reductase